MDLLAKDNCESLGQVARRETSMLEVLKQRQTQIQNQLNKVNAAIEVLEKNTELAGALETLQQGLRA